MLFSATKVAQIITQQFSICKKENGMEEFENVEVFLRDFIIYLALPM
jgi:hypothetical protein